MTDCLVAVSWSAHRSEPRLIQGLEHIRQLLRLRTGVGKVEDVNAEVVRVAERTN